LVWSCVLPVVDLPHGLLGQLHPAVQQATRVTLHRGQRAEVEPTGGETPNDLLEENIKKQLLLALVKNKSMFSLKIVSTFRTDGKKW